MASQNAHNASAILPAFRQVCSFDSGRKILVLLTAVKLCDLSLWEVCLQIWSAALVNFASAPTAGSVPAMGEG